MSKTTTPTIQTPASWLAHKPPIKVRRKQPPVGFRVGQGTDFLTADDQVKSHTIYWRWTPWQGGHIRREFFFDDDDVDWLVNEIELGNIFIEEIDEG